MRVNEDGALEKSTDVNNLLADNFCISTKATGGDASWINRKNEIHNRIIHNMLRSGIIEVN